MNPKRFPPTDSTGEPTNPAIQLYGRRFYKDQTPVEYLAEFLLVFASPKGLAGKGVKANTYTFTIGQDQESAIYWPEDRVALKLFAFFPTSKFDTRHDTHQKAYGQALADLANHIDGPADETDETIRLLQSLLGGFVGVAKNRTWATYSFLPATHRLLARELDWLHSKASKDHNLSSWSEARQYFATDRHNFMARGGEMLFLQLAHLFNNDTTPLSSMQREGRYGHVTSLGLEELRVGVEAALLNLLENAVLPLDQIAHFVENALSDFCLYDCPKHAALGWVPTATLTEAHLFAFELRNIALSALADLEKLELLEVLCCMQVLRTLCFQATRADGRQSNANFIGGYGWITANPEAPPGAPTRKLAQASFERVEGLLFRVLRKQAANDTCQDP